LHEDTERIIAALRALTKEERLRTCNDHDPQTLTPREILAQCDTEL
jgi:uncharacterized protein (DUF2249 family)